MPNEKKLTRKQLRKSKQQPVELRDKITRSMAPKQTKAQCANCGNGVSEREKPQLYTRMINAGVGGGSVLASEIVGPKGGEIGEPDGEGFVDEADIPDAKDDDEVWVRLRPGLPRVEKCKPAGAPVCKRGGIVTQEYIVPSSQRAVKRIGKPEITHDSAHTICIRIPRYQDWYARVKNKYYTWYNCCCETDAVFKVKWDCWVEVEYSHEDIESTWKWTGKTILKTAVRCETDWKQWTKEKISGWLNGLVSSAGESLGGSIGSGVGEPLKKELEKETDRLLKELKKRFKK